MDVGTFHDGFQWHRPLGEIDWVEIRPRSRSDAETWATNLCVSASRREFLPHGRGDVLRRIPMASPAG